MIIETATWNKDRTAINVNDSIFVPWPCHTWHREVIEAWLAAGNVIAEPQPSPYHELIAGAWAPTPATLGRAAAEFCVEIDTCAGAARARLASPGHFIADEYQEAYQQALAWTDAGRTIPAPEMIQSWAEAKGWPPAQAADDILAARAMLTAKLESIRRIRLVRREAVRTLATASGDPEALLAQMQSERDLALQFLEGV